MGSPFRNQVGSVGCFYAVLVLLLSHISFVAASQVATRQRLRKNVAIQLEVPVIQVKSGKKGNNSATQLDRFESKKQSLVRQKAMTSEAKSDSRSIDSKQQDKHTSSQPKKESSTKRSMFRLDDVLDATPEDTELATTTTRDDSEVLGEDEELAFWDRLIQDTERELGGTSFSMVYY